MRVVVKLSVIWFAVALVASASVSAQTFQKKSEGGKATGTPTMTIQKSKYDGVKAPAPGVLAPTGQARPRPNTSTTAPKGKNMAPLTASDCTDLGGTIQINSLCNSRFACARTDQNGKTYHVCINGK